MSAKQYNEWIKYKKYAEAYEAQKDIKEMDPEAYKDKSFADMIKSDSYESTSRQTHYFIDRISNALEDLEVAVAEGNPAARELYTDFITKFGDIRQADEQELVYKRLKGSAMRYEYHDAKHHGWHGDLMDMMLYLQRSGVIDEIYV